MEQATPPCEGVRVRAEQDFTDTLGSNILKMGKGQGSLDAEAQEDLGSLSFADSAAPRNRL